jgi:membrane protease YdiL (CAAX protease family)
MLLVNALLSALLNLILLAGIPFLIYALYHRLKHGRPFAEVIERSGLKRGETRFIAYCLAAGAVVVVAILIWPPSADASTREGSAFAEFSGLGLSATTVGMALLYSVIKTGFAEEFLFRGLIAGSLSRRLPLVWANLLQALVFLAPHLVILTIAPELWGILPVVFLGALFAGWVRIKSGSILGPWLLHAMTNFTMALSVAVRTAA